MKVKFAADIGGTFTDCVLEIDTTRFTHKLLTTHHAPEEAILEGAALLLKHHSLNFSQIGLFLHGTTLATNAIIERKGAKTALLTTQGFRDVIEIADEGRFDQYDLAIEKPKPLLVRDLRFTVPERMDVEGNVLLPLDIDALKPLVEIWKAQEIKSLAVCFLHSFTNPKHELKARELTNKLFPELEISLSHEISPEMREYERTNTTIANAYVKPLMKSYLLRLKEAFAVQGYQKPILLMTSGGGLCSIETASQFPVRLIESGPAGGAMMVANLAKSHGLSKALSFDMGGTTAKICLIKNGEPTKSLAFEMDRQSRFMKGSGIPIRIPVIDMVEIGAGGGSIAHLDELNRLKVGPHSAGSNPGAAAFDKGGDKPTVTDADLINGFIDKNHFAAGTVKLNEEKALAAINKIASPLKLSSQEGAKAITRMIDETMASATRVHAIEKGEDLSAYTMIAYGGAAPLHAVSLLKTLHMKRLIIPFNAGVGSAIGFLESPISFEKAQSKILKLDESSLVILSEALEKLKQDVISSVRATTQEKLFTRLSLRMRYQGQGHEISIAVPKILSIVTLKKAFETAYKRAFSRILPLSMIEITTLIALAETKPQQRLKLSPLLNIHDLESQKLYHRHAFKAGETGKGQCLIIDEGTSVVIPLNYKFTVLNDLSLLIEEAQT